MPRHLVITNGDWTTRHEIGESAVVIGRDPNCDLFFVNQKLSRRHARFEPGPDGVRLVDLGSRNGVWVNEKKIEERLLASGDSIRLGGLQIVYEDEDAAEPTVELGQLDSTVMLGDVGEGETLQKGTDPESPTAVPAPDATVILPDEQPRGDQTVMFRDADTPADSGGASTVIFEEGDEAAPTEPDASTRILPSSDAEEAAAGEEPILVPEPEPFWVRGKEGLAALPWPGKLFAALAVLGILFGVLLVWLVDADAPAAAFLFGPLLAGLWAWAATVLARRLLVEPIVKLGRDVEALEKGGALSSSREYPELDELAKAVHRLANRQADPSREEPESGEEAE